MNELSDPEQLIMGVMTLIEENVNENNRLSQRRPVTGVCVCGLLQLPLEHHETD